MNFSIDIYTGAPVAIPVFAPVDKRPAIDEIFALLESLSQKKKLAVAFDEFQEISKYGEAALKNIFENLFSDTTIFHTFLPGARNTCWPKCSQIQTGFL